MAKKKKKVYAVKKGKGGPAIYSTWEECKACVDGFAGALYKSFGTAAEAQAYIGTTVPTAAPQQLAGGFISSTVVPTIFTALGAKRPRPVPSSTHGTTTALTQSSKRARTVEALHASCGQQGDPRLDNAAVPAPSGVANAFATMMKSSKRSKRANGPVQPGELCVFTDGACRGNQNVATTQNPAGWGAVVVDGCRGDPPAGGEATRQLYGPVVLDPENSEFLGSEVCSNNTGELSGVCHALIWLAAQQECTPAVICYDSEYASNQAQGLHKAHKNIELCRKSRELLAAARSKRDVRFLHVKGHSGHRWNDEADRLANLGAISKVKVDQAVDQTKD